MHLRLNLPLLLYYFHCFGPHILADRTFGTLRKELLSHSACTRLVICQETTILFRIPNFGGVNGGVIDPFYD